MQHYKEITVGPDGTVMGRMLQDGGWIRFIYPLDLLWIEEVWQDGRHLLAVRDMFLVQDGFGRPGKLARGEAPITGARLSTPPARAKMLAIARQYLNDEQMADFLGLDVDTLRQVLESAYRI